MTEHALETENELTAANQKAAPGGTAVSSVHQSLDSTLELRVPAKSTGRADGLRLGTLLPAALAAFAACVMLIDQPQLSMLTAAACLVVAAAMINRRSRIEQADTIVLVGRSPIASIIANTLETHPARKRPLSIVRTTNSNEVSGLIRNRRCDEVVMAGPTGPLVMDLVDVRGKQPAILSGSEKLELLLGRVPMELAQQDKWLARLGKVRSLDPIYEMSKRVFDLLFSVMLGIAILPLLPLIAIAIKFDSPGSVLYSQTRVGLSGRNFRIYKFRTMRSDAEKDGAKWAQEGDPRITRVGRFMRLTRFDELPQIWNVIRGDMSVVGPRPERPEFTETLAAEIPGYDLRHTVKPGLTGWAQVCYRYTSSIRDTQAKVEYDLYYVKHLSFRLDAKILYRTIGVVLGRKGQ